MKKNIALSIALLVAVSCMPAQAIEIKEVNKTVWSTLKMIAGTGLFLSGLKQINSALAIQLAVQAHDFNLTGEQRAQARRSIKPMAVGAGIYGIALTSVGVKLMHSGYKGLTEEEVKA